MYRIEKTFTISASHFLPNHSGKCKEVHGHNWRITAICESGTLDEQGMVKDFGVMKNTITHMLDHKSLNDSIQNPTAERIAKFICDCFGALCVEVRVEETEGSVACYIK